MSAVTAAGGQGGAPWPVPPLGAAADDVHVHLFRLDVAARRDGDAAALALLDGEERAALARARAPLRRLELLHGRALLRRVLAGYAGVAPRDVAFARDRLHKPRAAGPAGAALPAFNVSHAGARLAIAVGRGGGALGVDIECGSDGLERDVEGIAAAHFAPRERAQLRAAPAPERLAVFLRLWTLKEALLKAAGTGLHGPLAALDVAGDAARVGCRLPLEQGGCVPAAAEYRRLGAAWHLAVARVDGLGEVRVFGEGEAQEQAEGRAGAVAASGRPGPPP